MNNMKFLFYLVTPVIPIYTLGMIHAHYQIFPFIPLLDIPVIGILVTLNIVGLIIIIKIIELIK